MKRKEKKQGEPAKERERPIGSRVTMAETTGSIEGELVKIIIPSRGRAGKVTTLNVVSGACLTVHTSEVDEYRQCYPEVEIIPHHEPNLCAIRRFLYEKFGNIFMVDDDLRLVYRYYTEEGGVYFMQPDEVYDLIQVTAHLAQEAGIYLFGYNKALNPVAYLPQNPFDFSGYINGGAFGMLKSEKLQFDTRFTLSEDHYISLLNAYHYRKLFIDKRFAFHFLDSFVNLGGCSNYRTVEKELENTLLLRKVFGEVVELKGNSSIREKKHAYERSLRMPF